MLSGMDGAALSGVSLNPARYPYIYRNESAVSVYNSVTGPVAEPDPYRWLEDNAKPTMDCERHPPSALCLPQPPFLFWRVLLHIIRASAWLQDQEPSAHGAVMQFCKPRRASTTLGATPR